MKTKNNKIRSLLLALAALVLAFSLIEPAKAGSFSYTGAMNTPRTDHTATLLANGIVLITGGDNNISPDLASAELYNPATGTWTNTGSMTQTRLAHSAVLLRNGKVLVAGGAGHDSNSGMLASAELYDPVTEIWTQTGSMHVPRYVDYSATLLANGMVLVAGGTPDDGVTPLSEAELYNPSTETWTQTGSMSSGRFYHATTLLPNGKVLVTGGIGGLNSAELYDPLTETWTSAGTLMTNRAQHIAVVLTNGMVLVTGGSRDGSAELFNPATGMWTNTGAMTTARSFPSASLLPNGKLLVAGGYNGNGPTNSAELYDPVSGTWKATGTLNDGGYIRLAALLTNGLVLVVGGSGEANVLSSAELYDPAPGTATTIVLSNPAALPDGAFQFGFTNTSGVSFSALTTTNLALPLTNWTLLGNVTEIAHGQFQFTDPEALNYPQRFYRIRSQ